MRLVFVSQILFWGLQGFAQTDPAGAWRVENFACVSGKPINTREVTDLSRGKVEFFLSSHQMFFVFFGLSCTSTQAYDAELEEGTVRNKFIAEIQSGPGCANKIVWVKGQSWDESALKISADGSKLVLRQKLTRDEKEYESGRGPCPKGDELEISMVRVPESQTR